jgi:alkylation response protein AidB-like acyl-CoA dehydrogenase
VRRFLRDEVAPECDRWERTGLVDRELFTAAGANGFLGFAVPTEYGGGGARDFRYNLILGEELQALGHQGVTLSITLHTDMVLPYLLDLTDDEQKARWLPGIASGELISAVAMSEPGTGSDLAGIATTAVRDGDDFVLNGSKTFITNGINADVVVVAARTDPTQHHAGLSLLVVEGDMKGFERGRNLDKIGMHAQDTAELFFDDVRVPATNLIGEEGRGFYHLVERLAQERLSIAVEGLGGARFVLATTLEYCRERTAFGAPIASFQNTRFRLADLATELAVGEAFVDRCVMAHNAGLLTADEAAMAKLFCTELQGRAADLGVQLHGGYGYMTEYAVSRAFVDARSNRIFGGTSEVMREIIGRSLDR